MTDANVVLGYLRSLLGGRMELHPALATRAVGEVAERLGTSLEEGPARSSRSRTRRC